MHCCSENYLVTSLAQVQQLVCFAGTEYFAQNSLLCGLHQQLSSIYPRENCGKTYSWIIAQGSLLVFWGNLATSLNLAGTIYLINRTDISRTHLDASSHEIHKAANNPSKKHVDIPDVAPVWNPSWSMEYPYVAGI